MENTKLHDCIFITKNAYEILSSTVSKSVTCFYKDIVSLLCTYLHIRLQSDQLLDVYDEHRNWRVACVVALRDDYVGIHFNGCRCMWDDWIHYQSARLAPLHRYSRQAYRDNLVPFQHYEWCKTIYNQFLSSTSNGYRDRLRLPELWRYIVHCKETSKEEQCEHSETLIALQIYNEALDAKAHDFLLDYKSRLSDYYPEAMEFNRAWLEEYAISWS